MVFPLIGRIRAMDSNEIRWVDVADFAGADDSDRFERAMEYARAELDDVWLWWSRPLVMTRPLRVMDGLHVGLGPVG
jgi:hypothetical protein